MGKSSQPHELDKLKKVWTKSDEYLIINNLISNYRNKVKCDLVVARFDNVILVHKWRDMNNILRVIQIKTWIINIHSQIWLMMNIYLNQLVYLFVGKVKALTYFLDDRLSTKQLLLILSKRTVLHKTKDDRIGLIRKNVKELTNNF